MRNGRWPTLLVGLLACGLIAAGCGDNEETSSSVVTPSTPSTSDDSGGSSGGETPDQFYDSCVAIIKGTPSEAAGQPACEQARDAFEQCAKDAESVDDGSARDLALQACEEAAHQAISALEIN